ncbi:hypothetical protein MYE70_01965 [Marinobacter alexandrii]|uniref:hypothetical protein n=1 Tax=Marinobacter alexandrii TaxID=2570351 RepID=UPI001FFEC0D7|nr:hypothetical protein [Marinobacter alexandrii]MCK2147825.1 hypothetical protein [Marinobacter alexandrii]
MKKLHALAFYALITPAITLGSTALLASHHGSENKDLGEQDMDQHAEPGKQNSELHQEAKKSKYNEADTTGQDDSEMSDQSGMKKKDDMESSSMSTEE